MARTLAGSDEFPLPGNRYGMAISWDSSASSVDIDLQAVLISDAGQVLEAVYYNNLKALGCITHSGDETTGERSGFDEVVWATMRKIPENVRMIIFVAAAFRGGHLRDAVNGRISILEDSADKVVANFAIERSEEEVDAVAMMVRQGGAWSLRLVNEPASDGQHFIDILEPVIGNIVRGVIPNAPQRLKAAFAMQKGSVVDLPRSSVMKSVKAGLGWDASGSGRVDLDVSAVLFDSTGLARAAVSFSNLAAPGIKHSGDNLTGAGSGDDETITLDFDALEDWVEQIFFVINIFSGASNFSGVQRPYCRVLDSSNIELARFNLKHGGKKSGLIMARLFKESTRWGFQALGVPCGGRSWSGATSEMQPLFKVSPRDLQIKSVGLLGPAGGEDGEPNACCCVQ